MYFDKNAEIIIPAIINIAIEIPNDILAFNCKLFICSKACPTFTICSLSILETILLNEQI